MTEEVSTVHAFPPVTRQSRPHASLTRRSVIQGGAAIGVSALALPRFGIDHAAAQATPTPGGMTQEATDALLRSYLDDLVNDRDFTAYFADDIVVGMMEVGQTVVGKDAAAQAIIDLHTVAFEATPDLGPLIVGAGVAALEVVFVGAHTGDFNGIPATGRDVQVPYSVFYELANDKITALRLYGLAGGLTLQVSGESGPVTASWRDVTPNAGAGQATPGPATAPDTVEGLLTEYLDVLVNDGDFVAYFDDEIVVGMMEVGQVIQGKEMAGQAIIDLHTVAFDATPEIGGLIPGPGSAALEVVFVGTHTGDFSGFSASGCHVSVPYSVFYEVSPTSIEALRIYGLASGLLLQLWPMRNMATPCAATPVA